MAHMKRILTIVLLLVGSATRADYLVGSPEMTPTYVGAQGAIAEDWGVVSFHVDQPAGEQVTGHQYAVAPVPTVTTTKTAGSIAIRETVYRAPIWPAGVEVLTAEMENKGASEEAVRVRLALPDGVAAGDCLGVAGGRPVLALMSKPQPRVRTREWGCTGGITPLPGWAKPQGECDPAFANISAGMGGVPIEYQFATPAGQRRVIVLGFCESFWNAPGQRPVLVRVEGASDTEVDPIKQWGQHIPGCLQFGATDANGDGVIQVIVAPHPNAADKNPILNVIWLFEPTVNPDLEQVKLGKLNDEALVYVDVGGQQDQSIYEAGPVVYDIKIAPGRTESLVFLLAAPGGTVPNPKDTAWRPDTLLKAAKDVWRDWFAQGNPDLRMLDAEEPRRTLAWIAMCQMQANGFYVSLPEPGRLDFFSHQVNAGKAMALDYAGFHDEAARLLRICWDKPIPEPFAAFAQAADGRWQDPSNNPCSQGCVLKALANHAEKTKDKEWVAAVLPAVKAGAEWLSKNQTTLDEEARQWASEGLAAAAQIETLAK